MMKTNSFQSQKVKRVKKKIKVQKTYLNKKGWYFYTYILCFIKRKLYDSLDIIHNDCVFDSCASGKHVQ